MSSSRLDLARPLRFAAFAALLVYGCLHWVRQVAPTETGLAFQMAGVGVALALAFGPVARIADLRWRRAAVAVLCLLGGVAALAAAGIPLRFAGWRNWGELASGVGQGISALPNLNIPYRGLDEWVRWIVYAGAGLLAVLAAALAFAPVGPRAGVRPDRRVGAAVALSLLYAIPIVERNPESPFVSGFGFAVLLALFLGADRIVAVGGARPRLIALGAAVGALSVAALVAPLLDGGSPWLNYRALAGDLAERNQTAFNWNHSYSPLDWPRDGREVLRIKARDPAYWKATVLRRFDGERWLSEPSRDPTLVDTPRPASEGRWYEDIEVTVRALRSEEYIAAGFTDEISEVPRPARPAGSGTFRTAGRPLRPGDTYTAEIYSPRPSVEQLREAGTAYPDYALGQDLAIELPEALGGPPPGRPRRGGPQQTTITFPAFGTTGLPLTEIPGREPFLGGDGLLEQSRYARTWAEAQRLRDLASTPLDLVRRVRDRVRQGARYTEQPEQRRAPLDAFLFDTKEGYCQQFSGAMALLLRMAGVPARVASGFSPGSFDSDRGQWIVRDLDAHSWVEAFFPGIGWVTLDPTPTIAPPAAQDTGDGGDTATDSEAAEAANRADVPVPSSTTPAEESTSAGGGGGGGGSPVPAIVGTLLALGLLALGAWWWRRPHTRPAPLEELRRALARSGRPVAPDLTLQALERSLTGSPTAQGYVRKLRLERYAGRPQVPTGEERAALRDELGAGLGLRGRLRGYWALPPRVPPRLQRR